MHINNILSCEKNWYKVIFILKQNKIDINYSGTHQFDSFQRPWGERGQTDHVLVSLCLPKCRQQSSLTFGSPEVWTVPKRAKYLGTVKPTWPGECQLAFNLCRIIRKTAAITPNFAQWVLCTCPIFPPPRLTECGNDRAIWQLHLPQLPPAIPWQPAQSVEHHRPGWPQGQTLLQPLQHGTLKPVWIWLHPGNMLEKLHLPGSALESVAY